MAEAKKKKHSVLIVDDDRFLLDIYSLKFKEHGCDVDAYTEPEKALEKIRSGLTPTIVLLDIIMPGMNGFDFLESLKKDSLVPDAAIIVLSNQGQDEDIKRAMDLGADGYIVKASAIPSEVLEKTIAFAEKKDAA